MIYKLDKDDVWKYLVKFSKTEYGKIMFLICYSIPIILFIMLLYTLIMEFLYPGCDFIIIAAFIALFDLISFCIGSYSFYKEFRIYVNKN